MRTYSRKFDWVEAQTLREQGLSYAAIAKRFGVTQMAVYFACNSEARKKNALRNSQWQKTGKCPRCGSTASRNRAKGQHLCVDCAARAATKVKDGEAYCPTCATWKLLGDFTPSNKHPRRGVHSQCKSCSAELKRKQRESRKEHHQMMERAHVAVRGAVKTGLLVRPSTCTECGGAESRIEAHHPDYSKLLQVHWLCRRCHVQAHQELV